MVHPDQFRHIQRKNAGAKMNAGKGDGGRNGISVFLHYQAVHSFQPVPRQIGKRIGVNVDQQSVAVTPGGATFLQQLHPLQFRQLKPHVRVGLVPQRGQQQRPLQCNGVVQRRIDFGRTPCVDQSRTPTKKTKSRKPTMKTKNTNEDHQIKNKCQCQCTLLKTNMFFLVPTIPSYVVHWEVSIGRRSH